MISGEANSPWENEIPKENQTRSMGSDRISEIAKRVAEHCQEAKELFEPLNAYCEAYRKDGEFKTNQAKRIIANLQAKIARDAALLCAEEIISLCKSVVRSVPEIPVNSGTPQPWTDGTFADTRGIFHPGLDGGSPVDRPKQEPSA